MCESSLSLTSVPSPSLSVSLPHPLPLSASRIHGVLRGRQVEVLEEEPEQWQQARPRRQRRGRRPVPQEVGQLQGPGDRPGPRGQRRRRRARGAVVVLEPVRGLVKEQRARFYIMRRCVTMLVCWKDCS